MLAPQFQAVCSRCGIKSNVMQYHQLFGRDTTPRMSDIDVQNWNYIKWMVTILPPWSSYNLTMVHRSNECGACKTPPWFSYKHPTRTTMKKKNVCFRRLFGGLVPPGVSYKKGLPRGVPPPLVSIHKFMYDCPPPYRVGLPQGDVNIIWVGEIFALLTGWIVISWRSSHWVCGNRRLGAPSHPKRRVQSHDPPTNIAP